MPGVAGAFSALLGAVIGLCVGMCGVWLLLKGRSGQLESRRSEAESERIRLDQQLQQANAQLVTARSEIASLDGIVNDVRLELGNVKDDRTRFEERCSRLPGLESELAKSCRESELLRSQNAALAAQVEHTGWALAAATTEIENCKERQREFSELEVQLNSELAKKNTLLENERKQSAEKLALLTDAGERLSERFRILANEILDDKVKRVNEQGRAKFDEVVEPLRVKLTEFQNKIDQVHVEGVRERAALVEQVKQLMSLNVQLSQDAHNLTSALRGSSQAQGAWGEIVLERVLEASGLRSGHEYEVRESHARDDGSRAQPDIIIYLPQNKQIVIDSKVSLLAYEEYIAAKDAEGQVSAANRHNDSVYSHVRELSNKGYQSIYGLNCLDFVIMFVPVESAFILAVSGDQHLWQEAWSKNVLLVSPSTLLFVLRTVAYLWRQDQQNRNVQEIARRGGELYDKFVGFAEDFQKLGDRLTQAKDSYDSATSKLSRGRGNLVRQAEMLKELGVVPSKSLPPGLSE